MDVPQQQLNQWRVFMEHVYIGTWEIIQTSHNGNQSKAFAILEYLAANALKTAGQMEQFGANHPTPERLPSDKYHNSEANKRYLQALKHAMHAAQALDDDEQQSEIKTSAAGVMQMLVADVEREIYGRPLGYEGQLLFNDSVTDTE